MKIKALALMILGLYATNGFCALTTIATQEPTYPIAPYLTQTAIVQQANLVADQIAASKDDFAAQVLSKQAPLSTDTQANIQNVYAPFLPFQPQGMSVGIVKSKVVSLDLPNPIFFVGSDATSIAWLKEYQERLLQIHANGFLIQATDMDDVKNMQSLAGKVPLTVLPNSNIGSELGVDHYPVLVSSTLIEQ